MSSTSGTRLIFLCLPNSSPVFEMNTAEYHQCGIIPAHAGNTRAWHFGRLRVRDHPRACGEHGCTMACVLLLLGSSPRMRGTPWRLASARLRLGIIPAHAGNTIRYPLRQLDVWDHPRACGGTRADIPIFDNQEGIIPAHAGNTVSMIHGGLSVGDHPRACGEHTLSCRRCSAVRGSSPRMRGTRLHPGAVSAASGIIPAHAGNTLRCGRRLRRSGDHPRACGEHRRITRNTQRFQGSSPRMRGTLAIIGRVGNLDGIIPAHAGNTPHREGYRHVPRDHPRACGEHSDHGCHGVFVSGSSPRMRGTHRRNWTG